MHCFFLLGSLKNLTTGLIWLVTRVGGWGEAWAGGPWRAGKGGDGVGAPESIVGAKGALIPTCLTTGLTWLVTRVGTTGGMGGVGRWPMEGGRPLARRGEVAHGKGGDGGGAESTFFWLGW